MGNLHQMYRPIGTELLLHTHFKYGIDTEYKGKEDILRPLKLCIPSCSEFCIFFKFGFQ